MSWRYILKKLQFVIVENGLLVESDELEGVIGGSLHNALSHIFHLAESLTHVLDE